MRSMIRNLLLIAAVTVTVLGAVWMRSEPQREAGAAGPHGLPSRTNASTTADGAERADSAVDDPGEPQGE